MTTAVEACTDERSTTTGPNLFIVGAPKCGTSSMLSYLDQHPDIFFPATKEPLYFCTDQTHREPWRVPDWNDYLALFASGAACRYRGEASVWYLSSRAAERAIHEYAPDAKILIFVRNPVDQAFSMHAQFLYTANENLRRFEDAYAAQERRRNGDGIPRRAHFPEGLQYTRIATYAGDVRSYFERFGPDRVRVVVAEDLFADPDGVLDEVLDFLDLDPGFRPDTEAVNQRRYIRSLPLQRVLTKAPQLWEGEIPKCPRLVQRMIDWARPRIHGRLWNWNVIEGSKARLDPETRSRLLPDFEADIRALEGLLDRDLSIWRRPASR